MHSVLVQHFVSGLVCCVNKPHHNSAIAIRSDTGSHNRLDLIQSLAQPHYVCHGYILIEMKVSNCFIIKLLLMSSGSCLLKLALNTTCFFLCNNKRCMNTAKNKLDRSRGTFGIVYPLRASGFNPGFCRVGVAILFFAVFYVVLLDCLSSSCVLCTNVVSVSGSSILDCPFSFL